jgi:hypothetical protein
MSPRFIVEPVEDFREPEEYGEELESVVCWWSVIEIDDDGDHIDISSHIDEDRAIAEAERLNAEYERAHASA